MAAAPPPPLPIPPVARRVETPAPAAAVDRAYGEARARHLIVNPDWARRPSEEDIAEHYPERALRTQTSGRATISCTVTVRGALADCEVLSETPERYGFGEAALKLSRIFRMKPQTPNGAPVEGGAVRVPLEFKPPG
jgi:protein TonB